MLTDRVPPDDAPSTAHSAALYARACDVLPGGNTRTTVFHEPYPLYAASGDGCRVFDVDGTERLDFLCNHTSLLHGHAEPTIVAAVTRQIASGSCFSMPTEHEIELANMIRERLATAELVWFVGSGTDSVTLAAKLARAYTRRTRIAKCEGAYHGTYDPVYVNVGTPPHAWDGLDAEVIPEVRGVSAVTAAETVVLPFNDPDEAERIIREHGTELAAVFVDPMPNRVGLTPATPAYLARLRNVTCELGVLLIFDEVITFRLGWHGAQGEYGIEPDLTTLAKIIGGGLPIGAVCGREDVMALLDPRGDGPAVPHGGTYNANPLSLAAGIAALRRWTPDAVTRLNWLGSSLRERIAEAFAAAGVQGSVTGAGSLCRLHLGPRPVVDYRSSYPGDDERDRMRRLHRYLLDHGILAGSNGLLCLSTAMGENEIDRLVETLAAGLARLGDSVRKDHSRTGTDQGLRTHGNEE